MSLQCQTDFHPHPAQGDLLFCCFAATSAATFISRLSGETLELLLADEQLFFYCNMPTVRPLSHEESQKKLTSFCYIISPFTVRPLSHGGNNKRFDFHLLYYSFSQKEKENSCNFISGL